MSDFQAVPVILSYAVLVPQNIREKGTGDLREGQSSCVGEDETFVRTDARYLICELINQSNLFLTSKIVQLHEKLPELKAARPRHDPFNQTGYLSCKEYSSPYTLELSTNLNTL